MVALARDNKSMHAQDMVCATEPEVQGRTMIYMATGALVHPERGFLQVW